VKVVSVREMQEMDRKAIEDKGIPSLTLMENAGRHVSEVAVEELGGLSKSRVSVFCGTGNNGGDGFVAARYLAKQGIGVQVYIIGDKARIKGDPEANLNKLAEMRIKAEEIGSPVKRDTDLIIDAIFGIGLKGKVKGPIKSIISGLNKEKIPIISVDVPSGLDADTGKVLGEAIKAKKTVTMQFAKKGFYLKDGPEYTGEVRIVDIGIPEGLCAA